MVGTTVVKLGVQAKPGEVASETGRMTTSMGTLGARTTFMTTTATSREKVSRQAGSRSRTSTVKVLMTFTVPIGNQARVAHADNVHSSSRPTKVNGRAKSNSRTLSVERLLMAATTSQKGTAPLITMINGMVTLFPLRQLKTTIERSMLSGSGSRLKMDETLTRILTPSRRRDKTFRQTMRDGLREKQSMGSTNPNLTLPFTKKTGNITTSTCARLGNCS